jgi:hypothetical protein
LPIPRTTLSRCRCEVCGSHEAPKLIRWFRLTSPSVLRATPNPAQAGQHQLHSHDKGLCEDGRASPGPTWPAGTWSVCSPSRALSTFHSHSSPICTAAASHCFSVSEWLLRVIKLNLERHHHGGHSSSSLILFSLICNLFYPFHYPTAEKQKREKRNTIPNYIYGLILKVVGFFFFFVLYSSSYRLLRPEFS